MISNKRKISRIAGFLYLIIVITGMFSLAYVPNQLFVWDNPAKTFDNIVSNETLFRFSIASSVICYITFILLPIVLHQLLQSVNNFHANMMVILAIVSVPISLFNLHHKYSILSLIDSSKLQDIQEVHERTMLHLSQYNDGVFIATIFWGLWLFPFGYLVYKSGFLPKILGILLILGCFAYMANFFGNTLSSNYKNLAIGNYLGFLPAIGEIGTCLWLLLIGAKETKN